MTGLSSSAMEPTDPDAELLGRLEDDLAAVEAAMSGLDGVGGVDGGAAAAAQIGSIVGSDRFAVGSSDLVGDGLVHEQVHPVAGGPHALDA